MLTSARPAAIVTGASSGIGAACARAFVRAGMDVTLTARRLDRLSALAAELAGQTGRVLAVPADVTDEGAMRTLASRSLAAFGRIDILVCSAGISFHGPVEETTPEVLRRLLEVNVIGTLNAVRAVLPYFEAQRAGHIIAISSIVGRRGLPGYTAYSAAKFAQTGLTEALRAEVRTSNIAVTTVFPVTVATELRAAMARDFGVRIEGGGPAQSADQVADAALRAVRTREAEVYPLRRARLLVWLNALAPRLADRLSRRFARRRMAAPAEPSKQTPGA